MYFVLMEADLSCFNPEAMVHVSSVKKLFHSSSCFTAVPVYSVAVAHFFYASIHFFIDYTNM